MIIDDNDPVIQQRCCIMGVTLQSILGVFLILEICSSAGNNTIHQNVSIIGEVDTNINLIEKVPKTDAELNIANEDTQKNINHDLELDGNQSHLDFKHEDENDSEKENISNNVVEKENKDNSINQDSIEKNRENDSRSINIKKYISPEFQNNVYTHPVASDIEKHVNESNLKSTTQKYLDYANLELSTPKTEFFDKKFKEAKQKLDQEYEFNGFEDVHHDNNPHESQSRHEDFEIDNFDSENSDDLQMHNLFDNPHTSTDYKEQTNISKNNTIDKNSKHDDLTIEQMKKVNVVSSYVGTSTYKYSFKEDMQQPETSSPKTYIQTTGKSTTLTKPPTNNNSHILSNRIETETIKAIRSFPESSTKRFRGENELVPKEQNVEENKIKLLNITAPIQTTTGYIPTTPIITTTSKDGVIRYNIPENRSDFESTTLNGELTTYESETTTSDTNTSNSSEESTTNNEEVTTSGIESTVFTAESSTNKQETNAAYKISSTSRRESTTENDKTTTDEQETTEGTTSAGLVTQTTESSIQTVFTTFNASDFTSDVTITPSIEQTTISATTKDFTSNVTITSSIEQTTIPATTKDFTSDVTITSSIEQTTISATSNDVRNEITPGGEVSTDTDDPETTESGARVSKGVLFTESSSEVFETTTDMITSTDVTNATFNSSETMNTTTETSSTEVPSITNESYTTVESTAAVTTITTVEFVHVETRDNHTTLVPETLSPNLNYPTPHYNNSRSVNVTHTVEQTTLDTTSVDEVTETSAATEHATVDDSGDDKGKIAAIVISTVGAVCLVLLAALLYLMRKRQRRFNYKQRCRPVNLDDYSVDNLSVYNSVRRKAGRQSKRSYGNPAFEDPVAVTHPLNFPALAKFADNTEDIKAEFEEIPQITAKTSELPEGCEPKNRYANVIPLPETRVFLKTIDGYPNSDYINANYVTGPKNTKGYYIACQAPLQDTVDDFWRMMWEQQSKVILMVTHFFENGMEKCFDYLPPSEVLDCNRLFGDYQVTLKKRDAKDKYIISSLQLKNMVSNSWREVTHFWYLGWPEKGVPSEGNSLIAFLIEARSFMKSSTLDKNVVVNGNMKGSAVNEVNPVVVHCSPGTGRTGVVIACDIAIREFEQTRLVDIPKIVYRIRRDRASAVQTKEQYMFIYKVISLYATKLSGGGFESF